MPHFDVVTWLWIVIGIVVVLLLVGIYLFNRIVRLRNEVNTGWSNIDVQLKRRNDLIPNLVEAVKGYAAHERGVFEEVTEARAAMANASSPAAAGAADSLLGQALGRLFAVAEAYPDLKASTNFLQLQSELTDTEDKISAARRYYNATVQAYNNAIQTFPSLLFAGLFGFDAREFFAADQADRAPVAVSFQLVAAAGDPPAADPGQPAAHGVRHPRLRRAHRRLRCGLGRLCRALGRDRPARVRRSPTASSPGGTPAA